MPFMSFRLSLDTDKTLPYSYRSVLFWSISKKEFIHTLDVEKSYLLLIFRVHKKRVFGALRKQHNLYNTFQVFLNFRMP